MHKEINQEKITRKRPQFSKADCRLAISSTLLSESDRRLRSTMGMSSGIFEPATAGQSFSGRTYRLGGSSTLATSSCTVGGQARLASASFWTVSILCCACCPTEPNAAHCLQKLFFHTTDVIPDDEPASDIPQRRGTPVGLLGAEMVNVRPVEARFLALCRESTGLAEKVQR